MEVLVGEIGIPDKMSRLSSDRMRWIIFRRLLISRKIMGFQAHWNTYAGGNSEFGEYSRLQKGSWLFNTIIGRFTYIAGAIAKHATIGSFCSIGPESIVGGLGKHPTSYISTHPSFYSLRGQSGFTFTDEDRFHEFEQTTIGNDVWIGTRAIVFGGVTVGNGAIIGAGAIVTKSVEPYAIVAGVPAKPIRYRFSAPVIHCLNDWEWWNLPMDVLTQLAPSFTSRDTWTVADVEKLREVSVQLLKPL